MLSIRASDTISWSAVTVQDFVKLHLHGLKGSA